MNLSKVADSYKKIKSVRKKVRNRIFRRKEQLEWEKIYRYLQDIKF